MIPEANNSLFERLRSLSDFRVLGLIIFGVIALMITWSGLKVVKLNYELEKQISQLTQRNAVEELENQNLKLKNEYYESENYLELAARKQFNKAAPGETLYQVPKSVALAHTKPYPSERQKSQVKTEKPGAGPIQNFNDWVDFLTHKKL